MIEYRIRQIEGYEGKIGELVAMLDHTRAITMKDIAELGQKELDFLVDDTSNSIGALLLQYSFC